MPVDPASTTRKVIVAARESHKPDTREHLDDLARRLLEHPETAGHDEVARLAAFVLKLRDEM